MKGSFTVGGAELAAAVHYCARWLVARPASPEQGGLLFEVTGDRLDISGFNENVSARATLNIEGIGGDEGAFVVAGRLVDQLAGTFGNKPVTFEARDSLIAVSSGRYHATMPTMSETDYPKRATEALRIGYVDGAALADAVHRVAPAARRNLESLIELNGVHIWLDDDAPPDTDEDGEPYMIALSATDRYQVARQWIGWDPDADNAPLGEALLVMAPTLLDAADAFDEAGEVAIGWDGRGSFSLTSATRSLVGRTLPDIEKFPARELAPMFDYERENSFTVSVKDLMVPLKRAELLGEKLDDTGSRAVDLILSDGGQLTIAAGSDNGRGGEELDVDYDGPATTLRFKQSMLRTTLGSAPGDAVTLVFTPDQPRKGVLVSSPGDTSWQCLMVPLRPSK